MGAEQPAAAGLTLIPAPTLTIGQINALLSPVQIETSGLISLGFEKQQRPGSGSHFLASDFNRMCEVLSQHISDLAHQRAAA